MKHQTGYKILINCFLIFFCLIFFLAIFRLFRSIYFEKKNIEVEKIVLEQADMIQFDPTKEIPVNFTKLKEMNEDVVGWIVIPKTHINYAIVKGSDNSFYLSHDFLKNYNIYGSIFMNYENKNDFSDANTILFGHNTYRESMFSDIVKIYEGEFGTDLSILIYTPEEVMEYQIYSTYLTVDTDSQPLSTSINFFEKSDLSFPKISNLTKTLTISTCYKDDTRRVILHAMKK